MQRLSPVLIFLLFALPACSQATAAPPVRAKQAGRVVRVAAISFVPEKFKLKQNADRLEQAFRLAKARGAELAVAPEGVLEGYVVNEIIAGKEQAERMNDVAVTIDDPVIKRFRRLARELRMCLVFGFAERVEEDVFNCAVFIDQRGEICGKYHKMQLAEGYHSSWWFNRLGEQSRAFDTPFGRCGLLICNDRWNAELARIPALDGAQFLLIPSFGSRGESQDEAVRSRSEETGLPIVEANVGVTLIAQDGRIATVARGDESLLLGRITIPPAAAPRAGERDQVEQAFFEWREQEMKSRYEKTLERQRKDQKKGTADER